MKFKIGDRVKVRSDLKRGSYANNNGGEICCTSEMVSMAGEILTITSDRGNYAVAENDWFWADSLLVASNKKQKPTKPDDMVRFMVYGTGCNNKSDLITTEKELKEKVKKLTNDSSWTGRIIGYKLVPLFEGEKTTKLKMFKTAKLKAVKK